MTENQDEILKELGLTGQLSVPVTQTDRYRQLEDKAYGHIQVVQDALDNSLAVGDLSDLKVFTSAIKDLTATYNDLSRQRQMAEIQEGQLLPMNILEKYKVEFYPRLQKGLEELRLSIENLLPPTMVPEFKSAWNRSYRKYTDAARNAEEAINDVKIEAKEEALFMAHQKDNNKMLVSKAVQERIKEEKRQKHNEKEKKQYQRKKAKK